MQFEEKVETVRVIDYTFHMTFGRETSVRLYPNDYMTASPDGSTTIIAFRDDRRPGFKPKATHKLVLQNSHVMFYETWEQDIELKPVPAPKKD